LGEFFLQGKHHRKDCIQLVIDKLKRIEKWFLKQKKYAFYGKILFTPVPSTKKGTHTFANCFISKITFSIYISIKDSKCFIRFCKPNI
jgi:hypothetical protein